MSDPVQPSGTTGTSPSPAAGPAAPTSGPPIAPPSTTSSSSSSGRIPGPASGAATAAGSAPKPPLPPLTGFRAALEHTGLPRGVLTYKPKLPSRKWLLFWSVLGTVSYIYYDDRRRAKNIKAEYIKKVEHFARQPVEGGSLGMVRTVQVLAARWPEDDDADRGGRYFRKYLKPYLVAAGVDYEPLPPPLYGAITRQTHAAILTKRRQKLGLEPSPVPLSVPGALNPSEIEANELAGGVILVGRPSLKEYLQGLKRGWGGGVDEWSWEGEMKQRLQGDGVFEGPPDDIAATASADGTLTADSSASTLVDAAVSPDTPAATSAPPSSSSPTGLSLLSRPQPSLALKPSSPSPSPTNGKPAIPPHLHIPPSPLPPQPPLLLVPWNNHLGFQQIPYMIWDFFTEHKRVESGAKLAYALICGHTRPFVGAAALLPDFAASPTFDGASTSTAELISDSKPENSESGSDLDFDVQAERYFKSDFEDLPSRLDKAKKDYYPDLSARLADIRALAKGERELTDAEKKSTTPLPTEDDLRAERLKREMRWQGQVEGWGIVKKGVKPVWDEKWEGWLRVFRAPEPGEEPQPVNESKEQVGTIWS